MRNDLTSNSNGSATGIYQNFGHSGNRCEAGHRYRIVRYFDMRPIAFTPAATRQWLKLAPQVRQRIRAKLDVFAASGQGDIKKLKGQTGSRLRVGDWRVVFYEEDDQVIVAAVGHRREIYD